MTVELHGYRHSVYSWIARLALYGDDTIISEGVAIPPQIPGIGFEARQDLRDLLATLFDV